MADYSLQYPGATVDALLAKVNSPDNSPTSNSQNLVKSGGVKTYVDEKTGDLQNLNTTAKNNLVEAINEAAQSGGGTQDAVKYTSQTLTAAQKAQARVNIGAGTSDFSGNPIVSLSAPSTPDGTIIATLSNGDTITIDLNHNHPQYLKYVMLEDESDMPATPDSTTLYMWPEEE